MEHEVQQPRWTEVFTENERAEAARRLARASSFPEWS